MQFSVSTTSPESRRSDCLVVFVEDKGQLTATAASLDKASDKALSKLIKQGDMDGMTGQSLLLQELSGSRAKRVLLLGTGKAEDCNEAAFEKIIGSLISVVNNSGIGKLQLAIADLPTKSRDTAWKVRQCAMLMSNSEYRFNLPGRKASSKNKSVEVVLHVDKAEAAAARKALATGTAVSEGMSVARDLGNMPANICTPTYLASQAQAIAKGQKKLKVKVLSEADMKKLKMGSLLSVSAGSKEPAKLIVMEYRGADASQKPIALVGKGVTFDTGGISLKPGAAMDEMKFDMCGAASVLGTMKTLLALDLPVNVVGIVPATENMPGGQATKPGDVVTSMSGQTIEILNTDAEGRLILCDALTYAGRFKPRYVVDIATLTGAAIIALGKIPSAVMGNDRELIDKLINCGQETHDRIWELPLWDDYQEQLKSNFADMANIGGRDAGTITAACFLARFTKKYRWAHLDIAGTAWKSGGEKGATGRPVPLLTQFILSQMKGK